MEVASILNRIYLLLLTLDVTFGKKESALNALPGGFSIIWDPALLLKIPAEPLMELESAKLATVDIIWWRESVLGLLKMMLPPLTPGARLGTTLFVWNALPTGFRTPTVSAYR